MMMSVLLHISLLIQTSSAFSHFVFSLLLFGPTVHRASAKVTESSYCLARHTNELLLNSLLARLTPLIAQRRREEARDEALG